MNALSTPAPVAIPSFFTRARTALVAGATILRDPNRLDQVLVFTQAVNARAIARAADRIEDTEAGRALLAEKPRIDRAHVDFEALRRLPDGTLGREYVRFLDSNNIGPEPFEKLPDFADERGAWIMLRMRQVHDLWHVLTGYAPDIRGEILLQAFTFAQVRAPSALLITVLGSLRQAFRLGPAHVRDLWRAFQRGRKTDFLPTVRWENHWAESVNDLRARHGLPIV